MEQNFNLYHIFYTVAKCRNISGAARELYISQPAISKAISKLEQSLNTTLFYRSSRGVKLTEAGEILYRQTENAFTAIAQGEEQLQRIQKLGIGHLSIGVSSTLCKYALLPILRPFVRQNPHIQISISCQSSLETMAALEQGSLDIGLVGEDGSMDKLVFEPLSDIQDIFVTTRTYLDNLKERIPAGSHLSSRRVLAESTLMLLNKENISRQYIDRYLSRENLSASRMIEVTSMDLLIEFAKIDLGIACVIKNFVREELADGRLVQLKMPVSIPSRKIGFCYTKAISLPPAAQKLLSFSKEQDKQTSKAARPEA
ncbi:MAG: LysR family transcriptional regulator [Eubacteriales bacterium]|nr:LysR family transcriptional regulator [Eubacteriales bacterium]